jgi:uncharacterized membrane protein YfhO
MEEGSQAAVTTWMPNRVEVSATGPGTLVLSEISYPGWSVTVDGQQSTIETAEGGLRAVRLDAGRHEVIFSFRPVSVYAGLGLGLAGVAAWSGAHLLHRRDGTGAQ